MKLLPVFIFLTSYTTCVLSAKILAIFHFPCKSHHILGSSLLKAVAKKGHEVTMISPFPGTGRIDNYTDIDIPGMLQYKEEHITPKLVTAHNISMYDKMTYSLKNSKDVAEIFLNHPNLKKLLNEHFDLVILNWSMNEAFLAIAHHLKAPVIVFSTIGSSQLTNKITRNPAPYSYVRNLFLTYPDHMSLIQRINNAFWGCAFELVDKFVNENIQRDLLQKYFPNSPPLQFLMDNVALVFLNSHYGIDGARPYVPNMIEIGGFHVERPKPLKEDLKKFLDGASEGVVFFSLGTNIKSSNLPNEKLQDIVKCFKNLKVKVLWKFERYFENLSSNVLVDEWFPQTDILAHPNVKAFITHGGRLSTIEAVFYGVPIVGIPFFSDQEYNIADSVNKGYGITLNYETLNEQSLTNAITEIVNNPMYRNNAKMRSKILRDQPLPAIDNAIYWVEYVLRHKGASHLQTTAIKLTWWQRILLDVIGFICVVFILSTLILYYIFRSLLKYLKRMCTKTSRKSNIKKKKN